MDLFVVALVLLVCFLFYSVNKPSHTPNDNASSHSVTTAVLPKEPAARVEAESSLRQRTVKSAEHSGGTHQVPTLPKEPQVVDEEDNKKIPTMEEVPIVPVEHTTPITSQHLEDKVQESNDEVVEDANDTDNASDGFESDESNDADEADLSEVTHSASFSTPTPLIAACASLQGMRPNNEDRFVIEGLASSCLFAVFDGHDGPAASEYCAKHLTRAIQASKKFPKDTTSALIDTFLLLDRKFLDKGQDGGSTAVVVCVSDKIYVASAGDSRCIAGIDGKAVALSVDHKPDLEHEKERIEAANHEVQQKVEIVLGKRTKVARVDGKLAVSRAIGDSDFKDDPSAPATEQAVTALPDIQSVEVNSVNFMVLACDGLFDVMSNQDVVDYITPRLQSVDGPAQLAALAKELVSHAITNLGSADNVTAVLLKFN